MKFHSTRGNAGSVSSETQCSPGLLRTVDYLFPYIFPKFSIADFDQCTTYADVAKVMLAPFFAGDSVLSAALPSICEQTFDFPIPLTEVPNRPSDFILELYHGPTSAFKDVGARFLAACLEAIAKSESTPKKRTVIVATSGDTGGAVAGAFFGKALIDVVILYPKGRISPRQEKQLCAWGGNIRAFAVTGSFDDCQKMAKEALLDPSAPTEFLSANSINLGRILPQMIYYAQTALTIARNNPEASSAGFIIPSGNLGNSLACVWAKQMGLPIGSIELALNANRGVVDFLKTGVFHSHPSIATLANAMDVSVPSNLERMRNLKPDVADLNRVVHAETVSDDEIRNEIRISELEWGQVMCPHTAVAAVVRKRIEKSSLAKNTWVLVATAHPAKFESIVEPLVHHAVAVPYSLAQILAKPFVEQTIAARYSRP